MLNAMTDNPFKAHSLPLCDLGTIWVEPPGLEGGYPGREWVYVFNDEPSTAFAAGDIVIRDPSATTHKVHGGLIAPSTTPAPRVSVIGVAQFAIAAGKYGFILKRGPGLVKNGTADITADTPITSGGSRAGSAIDFADGTGTREHVIGFSLEAEATNETTFDAFVDCSG